MIISRWRKRKSNGLLVGLVGGLLLAMMAPVAAKDIYFYRDQKGGWHFTDAPTDTRFRPFAVKTVIRIGSGMLRMDPELLHPYISAAAKTYDLDPALIKAVIKAESAFDPNAVSWAGAQGLMQLMPNTALLMGVTNSFSPRENIFGGSGYLRRMLDRFGGDVRLALAAYNIGPERVDREKKIPAVRETQLYVERVLQYHREFQTK